MSHQHHELTAEHLIEALEASRGLINSATKYIELKFGYRVSATAVNRAIKIWGMEEWLTELRTRYVEECLNKTFEKAINAGDNWALGWILSKYGHHASFLEAKEEKSLEYNKGDISEFFNSLRNNNDNDASKSIPETT